MDLYKNRLKANYIQCSQRKLYFHLSMKLRTKSKQRKAKKEKIFKKSHEKIEEKIAESKDKYEAKEVQQSSQLKEQQNLSNTKFQAKVQKQANDESSSKNQDKSKDKFVDLYLTEDQYLMIMNYLPKGYSFQSFQSLKKIKHPSVVNFPQYTKKILRQANNIKKVEKQLQIVKGQELSDQFKDKLVTRLRKKASSNVIESRQSLTLQRKSQRIFLKEKVSYTQLQENQNNREQNALGPIESKKLSSETPQEAETSLQHHLLNTKTTQQDIKLPQIQEQVLEVIEQSLNLEKETENNHQINQVYHIQVIQQVITQQIQQKKENLEGQKDPLQQQKQKKQKRQQEQQEQLAAEQSQSQQQKDPTNKLLKSCEIIIQVSFEQLLSQTKTFSKKQSFQADNDSKIKSMRQKKDYKSKLSKKIKKAKRKLLIESSEEEIVTSHQSKRALSAENIQENEKQKEKQIKCHQMQRRKPKFPAPNIAPNDYFYNQWNILYQLKKHEYGQPFLQPVDEVIDGAKNYYRKIKHPMDISTIEHKLQIKAYKESSQFHLDVDLIFSNSLSYNKKGLMKKITLDFQGFYRSLIRDTTITQIKRRQKMKRKTNKK